MNAPGPSRSPVAKAGWLIALIFVGWLAFLFIPAPKPEPKPAPVYVKPPPSRLVALGLPDNPDLEHLPEFFALWADHAEWKDDKTIFAYWNPGSNSYSYFFEATKVGNTFHFQLCSEPKLGDDYFEESLAEDCPIHFYKRILIEKAQMNQINGGVIFKNPSPGKVKVDIEKTIIAPPESRVQLKETTQKIE